MAETSRCQTQRRAHSRVRRQRKVPGRRRTGAGKIIPSLLIGETPVGDQETQDSPWGNGVL